MRYNGPSRSLLAPRWRWRTGLKKLSGLLSMSQGTVGISNTISRRTDGFTAWTVAPPFIRASCTFLEE